MSSDESEPLATNGKSLSEGIRLGEDFGGGFDRNIPIYGDIRPARPFLSGLDSAVIATGSPGRRPCVRRPVALLLFVRAARRDDPLKLGAAQPLTTGGTSGP
jgi:hypothetical protein